jgi:hypothetical protein
VDEANLAPAVLDVLGAIRSRVDLASRATTGIEIRSNFATRHLALETARNGMGLGVVAVVRTTVLATGLDSNSISLPSSLATVHAGTVMTVLAPSHGNRVCNIRRNRVLNRTAHAMTTVTTTGLDVLRSRCKSRTALDLSAHARMTTATTAGLDVSRCNGVLNRTALDLSAHATTVRMTVTTAGLDGIRSGSNSGIRSNRSRRASAHVPATRPVLAAVLALLPALDRIRRPALHLASPAALAGLNSHASKNFANDLIDLGSINRGGHLFMWLPNKMGGSPSKPSCSITRRSLLNVENARDVIRDCTKERVAYVWGIVFIATVSLLIAHIMTRNYEADDHPRKHFYVPLWVAGLPLLFGIFFSYNATDRELASWTSEELEFSLSGMPKKEYLQYRANDDRAQKGFIGTATSAGIISGTNILGPFLRGDR